MKQNWELASALTVRLGMASGALLGGLAGYWLRAEVEGTPMWPAVVGVFGGFAVAWAVLTWLARWHSGAGVIVGGALTAATVVILVAWWQQGG